MCFFEWPVPQGSILGPLFFLIYINDLGNNLSSTVKLFADDRSIFSIVHDIDLSSKQLNNDLKKVRFGISVENVLICLSKLKK